MTCENFRGVNHERSRVSSSCFKGHLLQLSEVVAHALRTFAIGSLCEPHTRICRFERKSITSQLRIVLKRCVMAMDMPAFEAIWSRVEWISFSEK